MEVLHSNCGAQLSDLLPPIARVKHHFVPRFGAMMMQNGATFFALMEVLTGLVLERGIRVAKFASSKFSGNG